MERKYLQSGPEFDEKLDTIKHRLAEIAQRGHMDFEETTRTLVDTSSELVTISCRAGVEREPDEELSYTENNLDITSKLSGITIGITAIKYKLDNEADLHIEFKNPTVSPPAGLINAFGSELLNSIVPIEGAKPGKQRVLSALEWMGIFTSSPTPGYWQQVELNKRFIEALDPDSPQTEPPTQEEINALHQNIDLLVASADDDQLYEESAFVYNYHTQGDRIRCRIANKSEATYTSLTTKDYYFDIDPSGVATKKTIGSINSLDDVWQTRQEQSLGLWRPTLEDLAIVNTDIDILEKIHGR